MFHINLWSGIYRDIPTKPLMLRQFKVKVVHTYLLRIALYLLYIRFFYQLLIHLAIISVKYFDIYINAHHIYRESLHLLLYPRIIYLQPSRYPDYGIMIRKLEMVPHSSRLDVCMDWTQCW